METKTTEKRIAWNRGTKGVCKPNSGSFRKGQISPRKGVIVSEETREKLRISHLGQISWNKGKKGIHLSPKSEFKKGMTPWNKGVEYSDEMKSKLNVSGLDFGRAWNKGIKMPEMSGDKHPNWKGGVEHKEICECGNKKSTAGKSCRTCGGKKLGLIMIGNKRSLGKKHTAARKKWFSENRVANPIQVFKDTKIERTIERTIEGLLIKYHIPYEKQIPLCKVTVSDFYLEESNIAIFCDGCYWHGCKIHRSIDKAVKLNKNQNRVLMKNGITVIRLWEHDINSDPEGCIDKIINLINFKSDGR